LRELDSVLLWRHRCKAKKLTAEEFLRKVDTTHELEGCMGTEEAPWQRLVARSWDFDPERFFPKEIIIILNLNKPDAQWEPRTADELWRRMQKGHQSLREKYGKV